MKKLIVCALICLACAQYAAAQQKDYTETVKELMRVSGSDKTYQAVIPQMIGMMRQQMPDVPAAYWNEFEKEITSNAYDDLCLLLTPVYRKHLTQKDLEAVIAFYNTPAGRKFGAAAPAISSEAMSVGQQWGMQLGQKIYQKLLEKGLAQ